MATRKLTKIPKGWVRTKGATTAPRGFAWYSNGASRFSGQRKIALIRINTRKV